MGDEGGMTRGDGGSQRERERERNERERSEGRGGREGALKNIPESPQHPDQTPAGEDKSLAFSLLRPAAARKLHSSAENVQKKRQTAEK